MFDSAYVSLYEVALYIRVQENDTTATDHPGLNSAATSEIFKSNLLISCLEATKNFLDRYLRLPGPMIRSHTISEKNLLAHALMVLLKLSMCVGNSSLGGLRFNQTCNAKYYLGALATRTAALSTSAPGTTDTYPDCFRAVERTLRRVISWYEQIETAQQGVSPPDIVDSSPLRLLSLPDEALQEAFNFSDLDLLFFNSVDFWQ